MSNKTILQSKKSGLCLISIGAVIFTNILGHFLKIPTAITDKITESIVYLSLGGVAAQGVQDAVCETMKKGSQNDNGK